MKRQQGAILESIVSLRFLFSAESQELHKPAQNQLVPHQLQNAQRYELNQRHPLYDLVHSRLQMECRRNIDKHQVHDDRVEHDSEQGEKHEEGELEKLRQASRALFAWPHAQVVEEDGAELGEEAQVDETGHRIADRDRAQHAECHVHVVEVCLPHKCVVASNKKPLQDEIVGEVAHRDGHRVHHLASRRLKAFVVLEPCK